MTYKVLIHVYEGQVFVGQRLLDIAAKNLEGLGLMFLHAYPMRRDSASIGAPQMHNGYGFDVRGTVGRVTAETNIRLMQIITDHEPVKG